MKRIIITEKMFKKLISESILETSFSDNVPPVGHFDASKYLGSGPSPVSDEQLEKALGSSLNKLSNLKAYNGGQQPETGIQPKAPARPGEISPADLEMGIRRALDRMITGKPDIGSTGNNGHAGAGNTQPPKEGPTGNKTEQSNFQMSDPLTECTNIISVFETGKRFGYKMTNKDLYGYDLGDANGKKTYGYGLLFHPSGKYMQDIKPVWTQQELESVFMETVKRKIKNVTDWAGSCGVDFGVHQIEAMVSACFNFGTRNFLNKNVCKLIANNQNDPKIPVVWANLSNKQGEKYPGLIKRRAEEANLYKQDMTLEA